MLAYIVTLLFSPFIPCIFPWFATRSYIWRSAFEELCTSTTPAPPLTLLHVSNKDLTSDVVCLLFSFNLWLNMPVIISLLNVLPFSTSTLPIHWFLFVLSKQRVSQADFLTATLKREPLHKCVNTLLVPIFWVISRFGP